MNKAEEQLMYRWGRAYAENEVIKHALTDRALGYLKEFIGRVIIACEKEPYEKNADNGQMSYYKEINNALSLGLITDWPSFVTYMTGETYE